MKIAVLLISLCLVLMGGVDRAFAGVHSRSCCYARAFYHEIIQDGKKSTSSTIAGRIKHAAISNNDSLPGLDGLEEEESDDTVARKFRLAGKYQEIPYQSIPDQLNGLFKTVPFIFHQDSEKYIFQRVFRV